MTGYASIGKDILIIDKYFKQYFKTALKKYNLNTAEGLVLLMLYDKKNFHDHGRTPDEIVNELHYDKSVMTRTMQSLEQKGYLLRNPNPNDSRSFLFTLTEKAEIFKPHLIKHLIVWNNHFLQGISQENLQIIQASFSIMIENAMNLVNNNTKITRGLNL